MTVHVPPSPSASQVPEYARRLDDLKIRTRNGHGSRRQRQAGQRSSSSACCPAPATSSGRVRFPTRRVKQAASSEARPSRSWALQSAGIALVASLVVSALANLVMIGADGGRFAYGVVNIAALLSGMGWGL